LSGFLLIPAERNVKSFHSGYIVYTFSPIKANHMQGRFFAKQNNRLLSRKKHIYIVTHISYFCQNGILILQKKRINNPKRSCRCSQLSE